MKQICFFVIVISLFLCACNNDLKTIGQDIINNGNYVGEDVLSVTNTATIKVDSFITSSGIRSNSYIPQLIIGRHKEEYGGTTTAIPCFQIAPTYRPSVDPNATLDSVTFHFRFGGSLWGDTLYDLTLQTFDLYRLSGLPELDYDDNGYFYNNSSVDIREKIGSTTFFPKKVNINKAYFKVDEELGEDLFERMKFRSDDDIYKMSSSSIPFLNFLQYFRGLAIVPAATNNCLLAISSLSDSLYLQFNYKEAGVERVIRFPISQREYQYNQIQTKTEASDRFASLVQQEDQVSFEAADIALAQGLSGYMVKLVLPQPPRHGHYSTIIKAELEIKPEYFKNNPISYPNQITVYTTDDLNRITGVLSQNSTTNVTGFLRPNEQAPDKTRYVFDLTEFYQRLSTNPPLSKDPQLLLSIPNLSLSYDYMVVRQIPTVKIYYANYRQ